MVADCSKCMKEKGLGYFKIVVNQIRGRCDLRFDDEGNEFDRQTAIAESSVHFVTARYGRNISLFLKRLKSKGRVDVVTQDGFAGFEIAVQIAFDSFAPKRLAKLRVGLRPRPDGFFEV